MKLVLKLFLLMSVLWFCVAAAVGFRRSSDHKVFQYTNTLLNSDVFIVGRMSPDTNYNYAYSNLIILMTNVATSVATSNGVSASTATNIAAYQAFLATNGWMTVATNIAAYQAFLATNNYLPVVSNYVYSATNNLAPTNTGIAGQVLTVSANGGATRWDYVNQTLTNSNPLVPDFNLPHNKFTTNAAFLWLACANVDTTGRKIQVTDITVTNSTAAAVLATFPASVKVTGTPYITNETDFHWRVTPWRTNCACEPIF